MARGRKTIVGKCRLCLAEGELSFEHVPPARAFNDTRVRRYTMDEWVKAEGSLGKGGLIDQGGVGAYTLCKRCNNNTGAWYGREYVLWAKAALDLLGGIPTGAALEFHVNNHHPLRFLKQVVTMFFSLNSIEVSEGNRDLAQFVLDKHSRAFPKRFDVFLALYKGPLARYLPLTGRLQVGIGHQILSELAYPPFAVVISPTPRAQTLVGCISHFSDFGYDDCRDGTVRTVCGEGHTPYPYDYRTKEQMESDARRDREVAEQISR
jgi:hypothetical protein